MITTNATLSGKELILPPPRPSLTQLPNVKKLFLPDHNYVFCDADLQQADAQVVAWDAGVERLKKVFRDPNLDLHTENAKIIFGSCPNKGHPNRKKAKAGVHAVNYHVFARTLSGTLGCTEEEAQHFIDTWLRENPEIAAWHERVFDEMNTRRYVENRFGGRKYFYDATDQKTSLSEALAWIPQSTVALVINKVWEKIDQLDPRVVRVMMQVHDSLCFQIHCKHLLEGMEMVKECFDTVVVPYEDPLVIGSSIAVGPNWGDVVDCTWDGFIVDTDTGHPTTEKIAYLR